MEKLDLYCILKGHEGKTFYSRCFGEVILISSQELTFESIENKKVIQYYINGYYSKSGEQDLFPSKDQRDWNKWDKENNNKAPKTWSELIKVEDIFTAFAEISSNGGKDESETFLNTPIEKSALALLKIHKLIEVSYGGNVTDDEWIDNNIKWYINYSIIDKEIAIFEGFIYKSLIAFHTKKQAKEFLSYPENIQLLKDYFMV